MIKNTYKPYKKIVSICVLSSFASNSQSTFVNVEQSKKLSLEKPFKSKPMKKTLFKFTMLSALLLVVGCGQAPEKVEQTVAPETTSTLEIEKPQLTFGFIKLTDMAPLAIAKEKGYFEDEGLFVSVEAQSNWKNVLDRVIDGQLDGSHMLAGQPIAAGAGFGRQAELVTPFSMDLNGNGITVSNNVWSMMKPNIAKDEEGKPIHPIRSSALKPLYEFV